MVAPVFPSGQTRSVCPGVMLKQAGATSLVGKDFLPAHSRYRDPVVRQVPWPFCKLREDGYSSLICSTCQMFFAGIAQASMPATTVLLCIGLFRYFSGSESLFLPDLCMIRRSEPSNSTRLRRSVANPSLERVACEPESHHHQPDLLRSRAPHAADVDAPSKPSRLRRPAPKGQRPGHGDGVIAAYRRRLDPPRHQPIVSEPTSPAFAVSAHHGQP